MFFIVAAKNIQVFPFYTTLSCMAPQIICCYIHFHLRLRYTSWGVKKHFIRSQKKMQLRCTLVLPVLPVLPVMLAMAVGLILEKQGKNIAQ